MALLKIDAFSGKFGEAVNIPVATQLAKTESKRQSEAVRIRPDSSFKIKSMLSEVVKEQPGSKPKVEVVKYEQVEEREAIDVAKVADAVERYISEYKPEPLVVMALKTHQPFVEKEQVVLFADNQLQLDKLDAMKMHFLHALMKTLHNGYLALDFRLFDANITTEAKKIFTASEKFEHFIELNPVVADLKNIFGLEFD